MSNIRNKIDERLKGKTVEIVGSCAVGESIGYQLRILNAMKIEDYFIEDAIICAVNKKEIKINNAIVEKGVIKIY